MDDEIMESMSRMTYLVFKSWVGWWTLKMICGNGRLMLDNCILMLLLMIWVWFVKVVSWKCDCVWAEGDGRKLYDI